MQETRVHYSILQFEVDFKQHYDLIVITMMVFTFLHFVFFFAVLH